MSRAELERIKQSVATNDNRSHNERKAALKRLSEDRVKHWPNTLEALRKKKESFLKDKEAKDEQRRQEIDLQVIILYLVSRKIRHDLSS